MVKFFRDPIHDIIRVEEPHILKLIDSLAMQRLRHIRQLGLAWIVYPGAEHSRFCHSLGCYHLAKRVTHHLRSTIPGKLDDEQIKILLTAALLHDIGHGPFSHMFENLCNQDLGVSYKHESWTKRIVLEDKGVNSILKSVEIDDFPQKIVGVYSKTITPYYLCDIISSQLDVDRFDYLLRDTHMTGARYGNFDQEWILRTLTISKVKNIVEVEDEEGNQLGEIETVVIDGKRGLSTLEQHILGRHYMYKHVYFHKTIRAAEAMLRMILKRAAHLIIDGHDIIGNAAFQKLVKNESIPVDDFLTLNDFLILSWVHEWAYSAEDDILKRLSQDFISRRLFKCDILDVGGKEYADKRDKLKEILKDDITYFFVEDEPKDIAYKDYFYQIKKEKSPQEIWFLNREGKPEQLSGYEGLLSAGKNALNFNTVYWHMPEEVLKRLNN